MSQATAKKNIIIIGGGISGLTCARELTKHPSNFNVTLLEASNRIGGRIYTKKSDVDDTILEFGAQYIHGTKKNPIYDYALAKGIVQPREEREWQSFEILNCFHDDVKQGCSPKTLKKALDIGFAYKEKIFDSFNHHEEAYFVKNYPSVGHYIKSRFEAKISKHKGDPMLQKALKSVFISELNNEAADSGCRSLYDLDVKGYYDYIDLHGDLSFLLNGKGYIEVINSIAKEIAVDCIHLDHEVDQIYGDLEGKLKVTCCNGKNFVADVVVLTFSIEVLKAMLKAQRITVPIPEEKLLSINRLGLGKVIKLFFKFIEPVNDQIHFIQFYPSVDNYEKQVHDVYSQIVSFDRVEGSDWWIVWLIGDLIDEFHNCEPIEFTKKIFTNLRTMYSEFPKSDFDERSLTYYDWTTDKYFLGSYSYLKVGTSSLDIKVLSEPVNCGKSTLLFAGELTDPKYYSTTHGGYVSGIREANRIIKM